MCVEYQMQRLSYKNNVKKELAWKTIAENFDIPVERAENFDILVERSFILTNAVS